MIRSFQKENSDGRNRNFCKKSNDCRRYINCAHVFIIGVIAKKLEGLGINLDGRMYVDEDTNDEICETSSLADNFPHGISPADL